MFSRLNFVNSAGPMGDCKVVLYQTNQKAEVQSVIPWRVIRHCGFGWNHPFTYSDQIEVAISDDYGNYSPRIATTNGQIVAVEPTHIGRKLVVKPRQECSAQVKVINGLSQGAITVNIFRCGSLVARKTAVAPDQAAEFSFSKSLCVGKTTAALSQHVSVPFLISAEDTVLTLNGIDSADIIMTGGNDAATPFAFDLANINSG